MTIHFEGASERRKELAQALAEESGSAMKYLGAPTFGYQVGDYTVNRDGSVEVNELIDEKSLGLTLHALRGQGFIPTGDTLLPNIDAPVNEEMSACAEKHTVDGIVLEFPVADMSECSIDNLYKLIAAKNPLIRMALGSDKPLTVERNGDRLSFPWLPGTAPSELVNATIFLIMALIKLAGKLKRVTVTEHETDNPRYAFRCFLLRLGFIGDEYKAARRILMRDIPGNGSIRHVVVEEPVTDEEPPAEIVHYEKLDAQADDASEEELADAAQDEGNE